MWPDVGYDALVRAVGGRAFELTVYFVTSLLMPPFLHYYFA